MPNLDQSDNGDSHDDIPSSDESSGRRADHPEREGLPRGYQMRADSHYVDNLESRHTAPAIRLIPTRHIDVPSGPPAIAPEPLVQSVTAHGILQPLLVTRRSGRYRVIAGRRRLAAAIAAGLTDVPCLTHDIDEAEEAAIADADNLRAPVPGEITATEPGFGWFDALRAASHDLMTIEAAAALLRRTGGGLSQRVAADLIQAQGWRAAWLTSVALFAGASDHGGQQKPLESILERIKAGFEAQRRLMALHLEYSVAPAAAVLTLDEDRATVAITGCMFATLAWLHDREDARVEVRVDLPNPRTLRVEIVQRVAPIPADALRCLKEAGRAPLGDLTVLALMTAQAIAAQSGGSLSLTAIGDQGSIVRITFAKPDGK